MISVIIKRTDEPKVIQMTQADLVRQLGNINGAEIILANDWIEGLKLVRTPFVCLVEPDCVFSANYFSSNVNLLIKSQSNIPGGKGSGRGTGGGGLTKLAMISSCLGIRDFGNRIYNYNLEKVNLPDRFKTSSGDLTMKGWHILPNRRKLNMKLYQVQVGFVPGAIIRMSAITDIIEDDLWLDVDLVKLSTALSFYFWNTGRRIKLNPNTTYVSNDKNLEKPPLFEITVPNQVANIFNQEGIGWIGV